jgi:glycine cleavage system aminomethyltransferase T
MENKQQTAVEWFFSELERMQYFIGNDMLEAYKQAKEMQKQQMIDFHIEVMKYGLINEGEAIWKDAYLPKLSGIAEQHHKQKYGGNK